MAGHWVTAVLPLREPEDGLPVVRALAADCHSLPAASAVLPQLKHELPGPGMCPSAQLAVLMWQAHQTQRQHGLCWLAPPCVASPLTVAVAVPQPYTSLNHLHPPAADTAVTVLLP